MFEIGRPDQLGEVLHRSGVCLGAPALRVDLGLLDLHGGERLRLRLASRGQIGASAALGVGERHRPGGPAAPRRFLDRGVDLADTPIEVGDGLSLNR